MKYNEQLLNWWLDKDPFTKEEFNFLMTSADIEPIQNENSYLEFEKNYINKLEFGNISINNYTITMEHCATDFINQLFDYYVKDDTLIISSENEHENVKKQLKTHKNVITVTATDIKYCNLNKILPLLNKFSNVFVYIIGTQVSTGEITSQLFFEKLKAELLKRSIIHTIVCDDVHGMFIVPRDYSLFDYILNTAHALVKGYDVGILISNKNKKQFGIRAYNWGKGYLDRLDLILSRKDKLLCFRNVMEEYFQEYISLHKGKLITKVAPHIFALDMPDISVNEELFELFRKYYIRFEGIPQNMPKLRIRAAQCIQQPELLKAGFKKLEEFLPNLIY